MVAENTVTIKHAEGELSDQDVTAMMKQAMATPAKTIVIDLTNTDETTTAALARLVVLRRALLKAGRDLRLVGLTGKANDLYEITHMTNVLPRWQAAAV